VFCGFEKADKAERKGRRVARVNILLICMYDVIYAAEIALCNINKLPLQLYFSFSALISLPVLFPLNFSAISRSLPESLYVLTCKLATLKATHQTNLMLK
jgi:hypothetical protein